MAAVRLAVASLFALFLAACAGLHSGPSPDARQALAPTGKLRVALFVGTGTMVIKDPVSGQMKGVGYTLGQEMAAQLGVPFEPVLYTTLPALFDDAAAGKWDVSFMGVSADRAKLVDFSVPHMRIDFGYLVPAGSKIATMADVDRNGVRLAVVQKSSPEAFFVPYIRNATLVRANTLAAALDLIKAGNADVFGGLKGNLLEAAARQPGWRVLDGEPGGEDQAAGVPKGRNPAALAFANTFVRNAKASGAVQKSIEATGLRGAVVAQRQ